jgi:hypothetical protein
MKNISNYNITIENPKGTYKSFGIEGDEVWKTYPLKGVTYPVDYGSIEGYQGEDGADLDVFVGTGDVSGYIVVWRLDVPTETKMFINLTLGELEAVKKEFDPVLREAIILDNVAFAEKIVKFKNKV